MIYAWPLFALIAVLAWRRLVSQGYSRAAASVIVALTLAQSAVCLRDALPAEVLGIAIYAVSAGAFSLAREQSLRGVIRTGGALAGVQLAMPFGSLFTAAILPALIAIPKSPDERGKSLGVLVLLLFLPALAAVSLGALDLPLEAAHNGLRAGDFVVDGVLLLVFPALTIAGFRELHWTNAIPALVGGALLIAATASAALGFGYMPGALAPASAFLLLIAVSQWPASGRRARNALLLFGAAASFAWLAIQAVPR